MHTIFISLYNYDDEVSVDFWTPLSPDPVHLFFDGDEDIVSFDWISLTHPIPISGIRLSCANESETCVETVTFWGCFEPE